MDTQPILYPAQSLSSPNNIVKQMGRLQQNHDIDKLHTCMYSGRLDELIDVFKKIRQKSQRRTFDGLNLITNQHKK